MASEWREATVAEIAALGRNALVGGPFGSNLVSRDYVEDGVPVIRGQNMGERWVSGDFAFVTLAKAASLAANLARPGDIVFTQRGTLGQVCVVPPEPFERYLVSQSQMKLTVNGLVADPLFFYYVFTSAQQQGYIHQHAIQTGVPHTNLGILRQTPVPLPPLAEQRAIAGLLGTLDDKIELNRRMNETLEASARALFKSWFLDFDPVRTKLDGRHSAGTDSATVALFPATFQDTPLGRIPQGWNVRRVEEVVDAVYDGPHATPPDSDTGPIFLGIKNLTGSGLELSNIRHISERDWPKWTRRVTPRPGDIVFSYEATLGFFALVPPDLRCCLGRRLALIRPLQRDGFPCFWFQQFVSPPFQQFLDQRSIHGATVNRIPLITFPNYPVLDPPKELKAAYEQYAEPLWQRIHSNQAQSRTLATLRDTLLPKLISAELRVKAGERIGEMV